MSNKETLDKITELKALMFKAHRGLSSMQKLASRDIPMIDLACFSDLVLNDTMLVYEKAIELDRAVYDVAIDDDEDFVVDRIIENMKD